MKRKKPESTIDAEGIADLTDEPTATPLPTHNVVRVHVVPTATPTKVTLPTAIELATLAALLAPNESPATALDKAKELFVEALAHVSELPNTYEALVKAYGNEARRVEVMARPMEEMKCEVLADVLELDASKHDDAVRRFLAGRGFNLKTARAVLDNLRDYLDNPPPNCLRVERPTTAKVIEEWKRVKNGRTVYRIPATVLKSLVEWRQAKRNESRKASAATKRKKLVK
jgi:hypothetical protein